MTGWRLGWMVTSEPLHPVLDKLIEFNTSGAPTFLQPAAIAAIRDGEEFVVSMVERCRAGREIVMAGVGGVSRGRGRAPHGAVYSFFRVDGMTRRLEICQE